MERSESSQQHSAQFKLAPRASHADLVAAAGLAMLGSLAPFLPDGSALRWIVAAPVLFVVPGYLLMAALTPQANTWRERRVWPVMALGLSLPVLGLMALSATMLPMGFTSTGIVIMVTLLCLALVGVAFWRRSRVAASA